MLAAWHEFYGLLGTAAAALVALLFVAASIGTGYISAERRSPTHTFTTPVVFHYTYVLFVSLIALVPIDTDGALAVIIGASATGALLYSVHILIRVLKSAITDVDDRLGYGAAPLAAYVRAGRGARHRRARAARTAAARRCADPSAAGQYPQCLGSDRVLRAASH